MMWLIHKSTALIIIVIKKKSKKEY